MAKPKNTRAFAALAIEQVISDNRTIDWVLEHHPEWIPDALTQEIIYGALRHYFSLSALVDSHMRRPLKPRDRVIYFLMIVGAYQLLHLAVKPHAAIYETVEACGQLRRAWAKPMVNAVLRASQREDAREGGRSDAPGEKNSSSVNPTATPEQTFDHPSWLVDLVQAQYRDRADTILQANNTRAPMILRVNTAKGSVSAYLAQLADAGVSATELGAEGLLLAEPCSARSLPGWATGDVAVQDFGAQLACEVIWPHILDTHAAGSAISLLDACAAPGGKLFHILERMVGNGVNGKVLALDQAPGRIETLHRLAARLGHTIPAEVADARDRGWWDGEPFTHILLDAPCSGTGTLRRHPDIKVLLSPEQVADHKIRQLQLLRNLWSMLAPGGTLLYCTCSILNDENDAVIREFLTHSPNDEPNDEHADQPQGTATVNRPAFSLPRGAATEYGWQLLPIEPETDGFYFACLQKPAHGSGGANIR